MKADDTVPMRKNLRAASMDSSSRLRKPEMTYRGIDMSSKATNNKISSRAEASTSIPSSEASMAT